MLSKLSPQILRLPWCGVEDFTRFKSCKYAIQYWYAVIFWSQNCKPRMAFYMLTCYLYQHLMSAIKFFHLLFWTVQPIKNINYLFEPFKVQCSVLQCFLQYPVTVINYNLTQAVTGHSNLVIGNLKSKLEHAFWLLVHRKFGNTLSG